MGNDAICVGIIIQKEQVLMQGQRTLEEGLRNRIRNGDTRRRRRPLGSKHNERAQGREMKLEGWLEIQLTRT